MSDLLTHWAVFDDCRRLAQHDATLDRELLQILDDHHEVARLGAVARYGSRWTEHILTSARPRKDESAHDVRLRQKVAFALGGLLHFPADQVFKPLMSEIAQTDWNSTHWQMQDKQSRSDSHAIKGEDIIRDISVYYDIHVFRKVYLSGEEEPFSSFFLRENSTASGRVLEAWARSLFQRALLSSHTLSPDMSNFDDWLDALLDRVQPLYLQIEHYTQVFTQPDPQKIADYKVESLFYRDADPAIQLARQIQRGESVTHNKSVTSAQIESALSSPENRSGYAECLRMGLGVLREASHFWRGETDTPPNVKQDTSWHRT